MASCTLVGIAVIMLSLDWMLTAVALTIGIPLILLIQKLEKPMTERSQKFHERESDVSTRVQETLTSIRAVQAYGRESFESQRFQGSALDSLKANLRLSVLQSSSQAIVGLLLALGTTIVVWIAATRVLDGHLTVGDVVLLVTYVAMLYKPLEALAYTSATTQSASASGRRVYSLLRATPDVSDSPLASPLPETHMASISFDHVSFYYEKDRPVIQDISLDIPSGQKTALVGLSGAGKTTLVNLLPRFYDPTAGRITLNGHDIRGLTIESLRRHIGLVLQEPVLFCATIRENIAYGLANADQQDIEVASRAAGAHSFIQNLSEGYDTKIGERGITLSGGQRQRISIARAFLKNAPILIMDEPTSALDASTETKLLEDLERLMAGRTTIIIAHRLSTIRKADRIVFMEDGRILEQGTHEELLEKGGPYAHLYQTYSGLHIPAIG
jgi:ATP-binding cassette subfamily B protein/subfamily B ATP-binding cassette protein MsbA